MSTAHQTHTLPQWQTAGRWPMVLLAILPAAFVVPMSLTGTSVALPLVAGELGSSAVALQWTVNAYNLTFAAFTLVWGFSSTRWGQHRSFQAGAIILVAASIASCVASDLVTLNIARGLAGVGAAAIITSAPPLLGTVFFGGARRRAFGAFGTAIGAGLALGPAVGGAVVSAAGWRAFFAAIGLVALAVAVASSMAFPGRRAAASVPTPRISVRTFANRRFAAVCLIATTQAIGYIAILTYSPIALRSIVGLDEVHAGLMLLWMTAPVLVLPLVTERVFRRLEEPARVASILSLIALVAGNLMLLWFTAETPLAYLAIAFTLVGVAFGLPMGVLDNESQEAVPAGAGPAAAGLFNFVRIGSEAVAVFAYSSVLLFATQRAVADNATAGEVLAGAPGHSHTYAQSFHTAQWVVLAAVVVASGVVAWLHRARR